MTSRSARGFTLIELMVAVAVAGILASVALPSYSAYMLRSRVPPTYLSARAAPPPSESQPRAPHPVPLQERLMKRPS